jgi:Fe-S cluster assembly scaffold protein SufB
MKGVAEHTAHVFCDGMIEIGLQGGGTDTYLTENVLMLDGTAKVDAIPGLEIKTNDVKASHSATVSKVTPEDLFYFATRGIDETEARQMYIQGFLGDLTAKITDTAVQDILLEQIEQKLIA